MSKKKTTKEITIRSSAAEYLTFAATTGDNPQSVEVPTINYHLKKIFEDMELSEDSVIRNL
jgi:hypothetical protein